MDGGRRLLKSLGESFSRHPVARAAADLTVREPIVPALTVDLRSSDASQAGRWRWLAAAEAWLPRHAGAVGTVLVIMLAIGGGLVAGGKLDRFTELHGSVGDIAARMAGFGIREVAVDGNKELTPAEVVAATGITGANSLPFLDVGAVQERLKRVPLIASAGVRKLFPDKLIISISERVPFGLWQKEGNVHLVAADGTVIDELHDQRFIRLPFVVGEGANRRIVEFADILAGAPSLRDRIRAGTLISERRWTLKLRNGVEVKLPEVGPAEALKGLARLDQEFNVLDKAVLSVDLRVPGRVAFRLTEDAAKARAEVMDKKIARKGKA